MAEGGKCGPPLPRRPQADFLLLPFLSKKKRLMARGGKRGPLLPRRPQADFLLLPFLSKKKRLMAEGGKRGPPLPPTGRKLIFFCFLFFLKRKGSQMRESSGIQSSNTVCAATSRSAIRPVARIVPFSSVRRSACSTPMCAYCTISPPFAVPKTWQWPRPWSRAAARPPSRRHRRTGWCPPRSCRKGG